MDVRGSEHAEGLAAVRAARRLVATTAIAAALLGGTIQVTEAPTRAGAVASFEGNPKNHNQVLL